MVAEMTPEAVEMVASQEAQRYRLKAIVSKVGDSSMTFSCVPSAMCFSRDYADICRALFRRFPQLKVISCPCGSFNRLLLAEL